ncbi:tRNA (guanine(37)-N1)-methyltransferase-like [Trichoplusia ni]|uniref:tRNA (guanine(37)-N1)-methyltransferase n=1 Tax=Trichoplusia ni TaxID=7111 RepID=A0A7E5X005_TRINI|nr:tRNA (guanine(37)-N1)-methyltransferase-like [Trichoplusia ni]
MTFGYIRGFIRKMSATTGVSILPVGVRGMKVLDRDKFLRNLKVPVLKVKLENVNNVMKMCKNYFLKLKAFRPIRDLNEAEDSPFKKCIYLNPEKVMKWEDFSENDRVLLQDLNVTEDHLIFKDAQISYDNWDYETIFKAVLPENEEGVSGFTQIGHIIHLNLRDHLLEYRFVIGQVLIDKLKSCRTVVNKCNTIDNTYRNFDMEVLAGDEDFKVSVKENNCTFHFDFSKVYWNSRLCKEHERILKYLHPEDVLFDIFCGVGPFAIPAAKKITKVFANDLNPESYKWLNYNANVNKIRMSCFKSYNQDGKDFICNVFKEYLERLCKGVEKVDGKIRITMNLPALAVEFLKYFNGLLKDTAAAENFNQEIIVYAYCFVPSGDDQAELAKELVIKNIGHDISSDIVFIYNVRKVAPTKEMMRVTFKLTKEVLVGPKSLGEPPLKKLCV